MLLCKTGFTDRAEPTDRVNTLSGTGSARRHEAESPVMAPNTTRLVPWMDRIHFNKSVTVIVFIQNLLVTFISNFLILFFISPQKPIITFKSKIQAKKPKLLSNTFKMSIRIRSSMRAISQTFRPTN